MKQVSAVAGAGLWVKAYIPEFGDISPTPAEIDWTAFTEIVIFTTEPTKTAPYYFRELPGSADSGYFDGGYNKRLYWSKAIVDSAHRHGVKVLMCLGGEVGNNASSFQYMISDPARRAAYIGYVAAQGGFMWRRNFDGCDIDYEFAGSGDQATLKAFFTELRAALNTWNPNAIISTAVPVWGTPAYYNEASFYNGNVVNQIDIMMYRQADGSNVTGYNSPLFQAKSTYPNYNGGCWFGNPNNPYGQGPYDGWASHGIDKKKIGMIIPFEMAKVDGNDAPGQSRSGWVQFANYSSVLAAKNANPGSDHWDAEAKVPWVGYTDGSGKHFYSYENQASIKAKVDTIKNGGFGGIGIWELFRGFVPSANPPDELLQFLKNAVGGIIPPGDNVNPTVTMVTPTSGDRISGIKVVSVNANDNIGVVRVEFLIDGSMTLTILSSPFNYSWNTTGLVGTHTVQAKAYDAAGNVGSTPVVQVSVSLPGTPKIKGQLFFDKNSNGIKDAGEPGMAGWTMRLVGVSTFTLLTDSSGSFSFENLPYGPCVLSQVDRPLWTRTKPSSPGTYSFTITSDTTIVGKDFGDYASNVIGYDVSQGWNLISLPLTVPDPRPFSVFPSATSQAISYNGAYHTDDSLDIGTGYWMKFPQYQTLWTAGSSLPSDTIAVISGWNLIGSLSSPVASSMISSVPGGILTSLVYGYRRGNFLADTLEPGGGYWVQASQDGNIILSATAFPLRVSDEQSSEVSKMNSLHFKTNSGDEQNIYFTVDARSQYKKSLYQLPPPFEGLFDVRFAPAQAEKSFGSVAAIIDHPVQTPLDIPIRVTSGSFPLTISWNIVDQTAGYSLVRSPDNAHPLSGKGSIILQRDIQEDPQSGIVLGLKISSAQTPARPTSYELRQNYPNPFNNSTFIGISLPEDSNVRLLVYNLLGEQVATVVDKPMKAGIYNIPFDASRLSSGVYFYRVDLSGSAPHIFTKIQRMVLIK